MLVLLVTGILVGSKIVGVAQKILEGSGAKLSFRQLFIADDKPLIGEDSGEVHFLLMGIGGENHDGGTLTDTMILATMKIPKEDDLKPQISMISIPRDLLVNIPGYDFRKINSAYAFGEINDQKNGPRLAVQTVEQLFAIQIPYYAVIDFQGFQKVIDELGGIEITVENAFTDSLYPDNRGGYIRPITFQVGKQKMDGERALQFVRSRHGTNNEGSDFARSRRQQIVLKAIKDEITSFRVLSNLSLVDRILDELADHVRTNLAPHELKRVYTLAKDINNENIRSLAIDNRETGLVCDQIVEETGAYILVPCAGFNDYSAIRDLLKNQFILGAVAAEKAKLELQNATKVTFLAQRAQAFLNLPYLEISSTNLKADTAYEQSVIYDNTNGAKPETLSYLKEKLGIRVAQSPFPFPTDQPDADFVIVLAQDLQDKLQ